MVAILSRHIYPSSCSWVDLRCSWTYRLVSTALRVHGWVSDELPGSRRRKPVGGSLSAS